MSETLLRSGGSGSLGGSSRHPLTRPRSCIADLDLFLQSAHEGLWDTRSHAPTDYSPGMEAVIFCGVQGSGKSTFYTDRLADSHVRINLDMLRTRRREQILLRACIEAKQPFVVDNTNPTIESRRRYNRPGPHRRIQPCLLLLPHPPRRRDRTQPCPPAARATTSRSDRRNLSKAAAAQQAGRLCPHLPRG